jgi:LmbE family N-acetylglucosaminyl deacetylase
LLPVLMLTHPAAVANANAAAPPPQPNAAQLELALRKLGVVGSVLYIAAHPDDENSGLLAYLANQALVRTGYLSLTRGDGGQNLIGAEQGAALGLIRTQELLAARRIDGAEQFFTRARDFGYSKTPEETLRIWGREAVLADVVSVVRRFRPDVIITRFSPEPADTHGHHTASAMLAVAAFHAAADPTFHPEQLTVGVTPWQTRRLFWNRSSWNMKPSDDRSGLIKLDVGGYNPLLGLSYGEMAADSRSMHKSQGFGVARARGPILEYFQPLDRATAGSPAPPAPAPPRALFDGVDLTWSRFGKSAGLRALQAAIDRAVHRFSASAPHLAIPALLEVDAALDAIPDAGWRAEKQRELRDLVLGCAGLHTEATAADFRVAPGGAIEVTASALNRSPQPITLREIHFPGGEAVTVGHALVDAPGGEAGTAAFEAKRTVHVPADLPPTTPYWLQAPPAPGLFRVDDPSLIGAPESEPSLQVEFLLEVGRRRFTVRRAIAFKWTDPVAGERHRPLEVIPAVSLRPDTQVLLFTDQQPKALSVRLTAGAPALAGVLNPELPEGWSVEPGSLPFALRNIGDEIDLRFQVRPAMAMVAIGARAPSPAGALRMSAEIERARFARGVTRIEHPHIPIQTVLTDAEVRLVPIELAKGGTRIGYIPGPGDEVPASLRRVGYDVTTIDDQTLSAGSGALTAALARFDAVVVGVRAYNTNQRLPAAHAALMAYVQAGGTLVVQYNTNSRIGPLASPMGPFPLEIGHDRVTDESAPVTFIDPSQPLLNAPNKIGARDFEGWIQERGLYFGATWDPRYRPLLKMNDPGERSLEGGLLCARHGKGMFIYTGLAFFRQLPAGVPGAFRLFANLLAAGRAR